MSSLFCLNHPMNNQIFLLVVLMKFIMFSEKEKKMRVRELYELK